MSGSDSPVCLVDLVISPQWVAWRDEPRDGKTTKVPYFTAERLAKADDPATWLPHDQAVLVSAAIGGGIGIELGPCVFSDNQDGCQRQSGWMTPGSAAGWA
jgi:primase-polymerase (primpol)-like protein